MRTYKTALTAWVPVEIARQLDERARAHNVSRSDLITRALTALVQGVPVEFVEVKRAQPGVGNRNRDGRDEEAVAVLSTMPEATIKETRAALQKLGILRGKNWVSSKRREMRYVRISPPPLKGEGEGGRINHPHPHPREQSSLGVSEVDLWRGERCC